MSGPTHILNYSVIASGTEASRQQNVFSKITTFFNTHPGFQAIAQSGSVTDEEAFRVWRAVSGSTPFDVVLKWSYNNYWTFWHTYQDFGAAILVGIHPSGQAWSGSTNNSNDTKPNQPFKSGSIIYARQNSVGGDYFADKNYFTRFANAFNSSFGFACSGDNDSFTIMWDEFNNKTSHGIYYFGRYNAFDTEYTLPYVMFKTVQSSWFDKTTTYGETATSVTADGCVSYCPTVGTITGTLPNPEKVRFDYLGRYASPIPISSSFDRNVLEYPILINAEETGAEYVGYLEHIRITYPGMAGYSRLGGGSRLAFSGSSSPPITMLWSSGSTMTSSSFYSGSQTRFMTGSNSFGFAGGAGVPVIRLGTTDAVVTVVQMTAENVRYRGWLGGQYVYSEGTPPVGATDIVIIRKN